MPIELPPGQVVEIEYLREGKANERGLVPAPLDYDARGFELVVLRVPDSLGFAEPFRVEWQRKWVNLAAVAEVRYLERGVLEAELERMGGVHELVRGRMAGR